MLIKYFTPMFSYLFMHRSSSY